MHHNDDENSICKTETNERSSPKRRPPNLALGHCQSFLQQDVLRSGQGLARVPAPPGVSQGVTPTPQLVTSPGCGQPGHEVPAPRPSGAAVDLPLTRARQGCSETAVSEWFEERGVTASFNSGGMTTAGRPARTRRSRVRRSCREGASLSPPDRLAQPSARPSARPPSNPPQPQAGSLESVSWRGGGGRRGSAGTGGQRAGAEGSAPESPGPRPAPSHVPRSVRRGMCGCT
ncbi:translation initiation factor IF-2-like [Cervus canadensis]|uniref:translation initiation factor IF-2-like n=1 Tax=Cervus canadensis TaxID=1574408 RepID=UPI001CA3263E|nr:translation initiation factor IF-2-like [Cervus canadensis]